jgi:hypothetical protein
MHSLQSPNNLSAISEKVIAACRYLKDDRERRAVLEDLIGSPKVVEEIESRELFRAHKRDKRMQVDKVVNFAYMTALMKDKKELSRVLQAAEILSEGEVLEEFFHY